ncbi:unnamed protein product, partial [Effrenium voratum]
VQIPVENGRALLADGRAEVLKRQRWWLDFLAWFDDRIRQDSGKSPDERLFTSSVDPPLGELITALLIAGGDVSLAAAHRLLQHFAQIMASGIWAFAISTPSSKSKKAHALFDRAVLCKALALVQQGQHPSLEAACKKMDLGRAAPPTIHKDYTSAYCARISAEVKGQANYLQ